MVDLASSGSRSIFAIFESLTLCGSAFVEIRSVGFVRNVGGREIVEGGEEIAMGGSFVS